VNALYLAVENYVIEEEKDAGMANRSEDISIFVVEFLVNYSGLDWNLEIFDKQESFADELL
jgi:hypothetical protein